jgi:hypothetical protein
LEIPKTAPASFAKMWKMSATSPTHTPGETNNFDIYWCHPLKWNLQSFGRKQNTSTYFPPFAFPPSNCPDSMVFDLFSHFSC